MSPVFWLPLLAAILFACAAVLTKRTSIWKIDIWRISFVSNFVTALAFQFFLLGTESLPQLDQLWQPAIVALLFIVGQVLTLVSLSHGEISVSAPVLGLKIVFVPIFLWMFAGSELPAVLWIACVGATIAVGLLNYTDRAENASAVWFSVVCAGSGAAAYALFDVCVQLWAQGWSGGGFLPVVFWFSTLLSLGFIPLFEKRLFDLPRAAWPTLLGGGIFFALQALAIVCAVAFWQQAAASNVVYSTRGLWSLLLVWLIGGFMGAADQSLTRKVFVVRLVGAMLLFGSIAMLVNN